MICLENVRAGYGSRTVFAVSGLSLPADGTAGNSDSGSSQGRMISILGRNGSGKSTFLRILAGILPYEGSILFDGRELRSIRPQERARRVSFLPQRTAIPDMTVSMLAAHGRFPWKKSPRKLTEEDRILIRDAMERTGILPLQKKNLRQISGGECRLAYLAMVLAQNTRTILLDEPAAFLDPDHQIRLYGILQDLAREGYLIILSSHDIPGSMTFGDTVCVLERGRVALSGSPRDICVQKELLRRALGVTVTSSLQENTLYKYALERP